MRIARRIVRQGQRPGKRSGRRRCKLHVYITGVRAHRKRLAIATAAVDLEISAADGGTIHLYGSVPDVSDGDLHIAAHRTRHGRRKYKVPGVDIDPWGGRQSLAR